MRDKITKYDLLIFGEFYMNDSFGIPIYKYGNDFYGIHNNKISEVILHFATK